MDYTLSSDYSGETRQPTSTSKFESSQREMEQANTISILSFVFARLYVIYVPMIMYITSLYLASKKEKIFLDRIDMPFEKDDSSSNLELFIPDEAVMYKVPPPKYHESHNHAI